MQTHPQNCNGKKASKTRSIQGVKIVASEIRPQTDIQTSRRSHGGSRGSRALRTRPPDQAPDPFSKQRQRRTVHGQRNRGGGGSDSRNPVRLCCYCCCFNFSSADAIANANPNGGSRCCKGCKEKRNKKERKNRKHIHRRIHLLVGGQPGMASRFQVASSIFEEIMLTLPQPMPSRLNPTNQPNHPLRPSLCEICDTF